MIAADHGGGEGLDTVTVWHGHHLGRQPAPAQCANGSSALCSANRFCHIFSPYHRRSDPPEVRARTLSRFRQKPSDRNPIETAHPRRPVFLAGPENFPIASPTAAHQCKSAPTRCPRAHSVQSSATSPGSPRESGTSTRRARRRTTADRRETWIVTMPLPRFLGTGRRRRNAPNPAPLCRVP